MKTIIAGSRDITDYSVVEDAIKESGFEITQVISGMAKGVDSLGELWAHYNNIGCHLCPANWNKYGKSAGPIRNVEMLELADALIVIINNNSRGSTHMLNIALKKGIPVFCKNISV